MHARYRRIVLACGLLIAWPAMAVEDFPKAGLVNLFDRPPFSEVGWERVANDGIKAYVSSNLMDRKPDGGPIRFMI